MTITTTDGEVAEEMERAGSRLAKATAEYMSRLKDIADITTLTVGAHGYDYAITVSHADKPDVLAHLADLEIESQFGVTIRTLAVAGSLGKKRPA
ncbi:MAG TPA: hypothetical protein VGU66_07125 [Candidatus Elarobacter sp.]|nr:hypothetical protein [Candidatus Elarobacter sp.]